MPNPRLSLAYASHLRWHEAWTLGSERWQALTELSSQFLHRILQLKTSRVVPVVRIELVHLRGDLTLIGADLHTAAGRLAGCSYTEASGAVKQPTGPPLDT